MGRSDVGAAARALDGSGPLMDEMLPEVLTTFHARRLSDPSVLWLNNRHLRGLGIAIDRPEVRKAIEAHLLEQYAACVPGPHDDPVHYSDVVVEFGADRYGSTGGAIHGGSGRVGVRAGLNVKGVGRTPLVPDSADWYHSHGCLWVEEALREAIYSELAQSEFQYGAVPVLAVIATGHRIYWGADGATGSERALLVRPNFLRLAHFQRSLFFGTSGFEGSDQVRDAARVRAGLRALWGPGRNLGTRLGVGGLAECAMRLGEGIGESHFWRLWHGPFFSSNVTVDGRALDYGSFRVVPDWRRWHGSPTDPGFGDEWPSLLPTLHSLRFNVAKHVPEGLGSGDLARLAAAGIADGFASGIAELLAVDPELDGGVVKLAVDQCRKVFAKQQRTRMESSQESEPLHEELISAVLDVVEKRSNRIERIRSAANYVFEPRTQMTREALLSTIDRMLLDTQDQPEARRTAVARFVDDALSSARRRWRGLPRGALVQQQLYDNGAWLVSYTTPDGACRLRLEPPAATSSQTLSPCVAPQLSDDVSEWDWAPDRPLLPGMLATMR